MKTVYVSIGNSDDKLTQKEWHYYCGQIREVLNCYIIQFHGSWYSLPDAAFQNACWCVEVSPDISLRLQADLIEIAERFNQDSIAWAEAETTFIGPGDGP